MRKNNRMKDHKKNIIFMFLSVLTLFSCTSHHKASQKTDAVKNILPYKIHQKKLDNGLKIVTVPMDSPGVVSFYTVFRVGARDEVEKGVTGFAHFFEHMMFRGTKKYSKSEYSNILKSTGASANANTTKDRTLYHMTGNVNKLETMFEIESDRFMNLNYSMHDFKTEAGAVKGEYTKNSANPYYQLWVKALSKAFKKHTYQHSTMGFLDDIIDMPNQYQYSLLFKSRFYRPEYATLVLVGDVNPKKVKALAKKYFGSWKRGNFISNVPKEPKQKNQRFVHLKNHSIPPHLSLFYKGPQFDANKKDMAALDILSELVFSENSMLFKKLVLKENKVRSLSAYATNSRQPFLFEIGASLYDKKDMQYVKNEIVNALSLIKKEGVSAQRLANIKSRLKYSFAMSIDKPSVLANILSGYIQLTDDPESLNKLYRQYDKVSQADLISVITSYFTPQTLTIGTISDAKRGDVY
jgi:zinc protease